MAVSGSTARNISIGAGNLLIDGVDAGATEADNIFRVMRKIYTPKLNGVPGFLKGTDYIEDEMAELEVTIPELSTTMLPVQIPGSAIVVGDGQGFAGGGGENTTLASPTAIGDVNIKVVNVTAFAIGDVVEIGAIGQREFHTVNFVGTAGAGGTGIGFLGGLTLLHAAADAVIGLASTTLSP